MTTTNTTARTADTATPKKAIGLAAGLLVLGVIIALIVAFTAGGSDDATSSALDSRIPQGAVRQVSFADVSAAALPRFESGAVDEAIGMDAPSFTASYFDNTETTVTPGDGTPRVMLFLAHWCPHCQAEVTAITEWVAANGLPADVEIVPISTSVDEGAPNYPPSTWLLRENWPFPVLRDSAQGDLAAGYGLTSFPFLVAVDANGKVVSRSTGELPPGQWEAILTQLGS